MSQSMLFMIAGGIAVLSSLMVVINKHAVHALLYLIVSLLALSLCFYLLGAPFAAALQIIVYAGAIMVLFVFALMLFNINRDDVDRESSWLRWQTWVGPVVLVLALGIELTYLLTLHPTWQALDTELIDARQVGTALFGPYLLAVEIASFLLLGGLIGGYHLAKPMDENQVKQEGRDGRRD